MLNNLVIGILALAIAAGQLIRIPFGTGAILLLDVVSLGFILVGFYKLRLKFYNPPDFLKPGFLFILISLISLMATPINLTEEEFMISFAYIVRFCIYILLGYIFFSQPFKNLREKIVPALLFSGIIFSIIGLAQFLIFPNLQFLTISGWDPHYFRTVSTFLDPNFAGAFFVLTLILLINQKTKTYLILVFFVITYLALLTTFSRSSYLMFLVSGFTLSILKKSRKIFLSTIILFIILLLGFKMYSQLVAQPRGIDREQSASFRVNTWEQGLTIFQKSPFFGIGFNAYRYAIREYNLGDEQFLRSHGSSSNDSSLLFVTATTGIVGLSIYLLFLASVFKYSYPDNPVLIAGLSGLLIHSIFANSLFYPFILIWILLAVDIKD